MKDIWVYVVPTDYYIINLKYAKAYSIEKYSDSYRILVTVDGINEKQYIMKSFEKEKQAIDFIENVTKESLYLCTKEIYRDDF